MSEKLTKADKLCDELAETLSQNPRHCGNHDQDPPPDSGYDYCHGRQDLEDGGRGIVRTLPRCSNAYRERRVSSGSLFFGGLKQ